MMSSFVILFTSIVTSDHSDSVTASSKARSDLVVTVPGRPSARLVGDRYAEEERMSEANKELVRRHFEEIWNRRDLAVADELMAEDYLEHALAPFGQAEPGRVNGPATMRQTAESLLAQFPDLQMTFEAMVAEGDTVAVRVLSEGTNLGRSTGGWCRRRANGSQPVRATGSGSPTASWPSTGPPARTWWRCCS